MSFSTLPMPKKKSKTSKARKPSAKGAGLGQAKSKAKAKKVKAPKKEKPVIKKEEKLEGEALPETPPAEVPKEEPKKEIKEEPKAPEKPSKEPNEVPKKADVPKEEAAPAKNSFGSRPKQADAAKEDPSSGQAPDASTSSAQGTGEGNPEPTHRQAQDGSGQGKKKGLLARMKEKKAAKKAAKLGLHGEGPTMLIEVKEKAEKSGVAKFFQTLNYLGMGKYRHLFIQSLATMLNAGLPLLDSLRAFEAEVRSKAVKKMVNKIVVSVENGSSMWRAMEDTCFFTPYEIALVHIGEDAGNLARNMEYLAEQQEKDHALKQKVKMAMIYPTIVMSMMFIVVMGLGIFVLPNLVQVLFSLNVELPLTTRIVIEVTKVFEAHGLKAMPFIILGFITIGLLAKFTKFKAVTQWFMFRTPGIGRLAKEATIARFGVIMGGLLRAGVPLVESTESLVDVTQVYSYKMFYKHILERIRVGDSFAKIFEMNPNARKLLPISVQQLVVTGERSGTLSDTLLKIADIYEKKAQETAEKLPIILEPMLLLFIGALVGTIAFAIIVPIYSVVGNVGG